MCHKAFGEATLYILLEMGAAHRSAVFTGSMREMDSCTLGKGTLIPCALRVPLTMFCPELGILVLISAILASFD